MGTSIPHSSQATGLYDEAVQDDHIHLHKNGAQEKKNHACAKSEHILKNSLSQ